MKVVKLLWLISRNGRSNSSNNASGREPNNSFNPTAGVGLAINKQPGPAAG
jgi:hypothetical protein